MKQSKRQARNRNRNGGGRSRNGAPATAKSCPTCSTPVQPDAIFCHRCGARLDGRAASKQWLSPTVALYAVIGIAVIVVVAGVAFMTGKDSAVPPVAVSRATTSGGAASSGAAAVDLSSMTPREAADRLFNHVMMASEQGNMDEAQRFAPMAIQAYERVDRLDADAHYHMGVIYLTMGDLDNARNQVSIMKQYTPHHLLALIVEHDIAEKEGNDFAAAQAAKEFADSYDAEIRVDRPEYAAHRNTIESFRTENTDR